MISNFCSRVFSFIGCHPNHSLFKPIILFNSISLICMCVLVSVKMHKEKDLEGLESLSVFTFVIVKYGTFIFGQGIIKNILKSTENFWEIDTTDANIEFFLGHIRRVEKMNKIIAVLGTLMYISKPFVLNTTAIFACYVPPPIPFSVFYIFECYMVLFFATCYAAVDILTCSLITAVVVQFRVLNLSIKNIKFVEVETDEDFQACVKKFKHNIKYHQFLLRYVEALNKLLSTPVALLMIFGIMVMCMNLYILSINIDLTSILNPIRGLVTIFAIICEFFAVFGFPSQLLIDESMAIAHTLYYECEWYLPKIVPLRKDMLIVIMRSQKGSYIRAGNYHVINNQTILFMLKTTYSFFAALQTMT